MLECTKAIPAFSLAGAERGTVISSASSKGTTHAEVGGGRGTSERLQDKDILIDCQRAQEEPEAYASNLGS